MLSLNDREWKEFKLIDLFEYNRGNQNKMNNLTDGDYPLVSAKNINNGLKAFVKENDKSIYDGNSMSLNNDGDGGVGVAYYQPHDYYLDSHCTALYPKNTKSRLVMLFLCASTTKQRSLFSHGHSISEKRLKKIMIMLPTADGIKPDYDFMEQYIKEREDKLKQKQIDFIGNNYQVGGSTLRLKNKEWREFYLKDLFDIIQRGKRLIREHQSTGKLPYVSSTSMNNGIDDFITTERVTRQFNNCLTIANSGSVGSSFYQPTKFIASDHITHLKNDSYTMYIYLFIATMTRRMSDKYNFNREINDYRISKEKILLPITDDGKPDYDFMEQYIKAIMLGKYKKYLEYIQR